MKSLKRNLKVASIVVLCMIAGSGLYLICSSIAKSIDREKNHPCQYYYPYEIISSFFYDDEDFFSCTTKYYIKVKGKRKNSNEECEMNIRVTEQKFYDLTEKDLK